MTLDPHHFQQADRHVRALLHARLRAVAPHGWGLTALDVDEARLANGEFALQSCAGVLPDGLPFELPEGGPLPEPRALQTAFPAAADRLTVYLAVPSERAAANVRRAGATARDVRYFAEPIRVPDENTGLDEREVEVARPAVRLVLGGEALGELSAMPVAEVMRADSGLFALRDTFVPTVLRIGASPYLAQLARGMLERLVAKSATLAERWHAVTMQRELSPSDLTVHGLHLAASTYVPLLQHHHASGETHPESFFQTLLGLAGHLRAFTPEASVAPRDFPTYDHADLTACFGRLEGVLNEVLGGAAPRANYVRLPLTQRRNHLYEAQPPADLFDTAQFYLVTRNPDVPEDRLARVLPEMLRIASPDTIDDVLRSYTRALIVEHTHRLPSGVPMDGQATYFKLQKSGPYWDDIRRSGGISIFVPAEIDSSTLELIAA